MDCVTNISFTEEKEMSFPRDRLSFSSDVKEMIRNTSFQSIKLSLNADLSIRVECEGTGDCSLVGIDSCFHSDGVVNIHLSGLQQCYSFCSEDIETFLQSSYH